MVELIFIFMQKTPVSHKVIEKRRRDRINRCLNELGKTVPMALAKQVQHTSSHCTLRSSTHPSGMGINIKIYGMNKDLNSLTQ